MKDYSELTSRIYVQLEPELSQEFHNMLTEIAQELSRLYEIENAEPSEALRELSIIKNLEIGFDKDGTPVNVGMCRGFDIIKQALMRLDGFIKEYDKLRQAFDIIKKNITHIPNYYNNPADYSLEAFNFHIEADNKWLSGEEREQYKKDFNFIKEVVK